MRLVDFDPQEGSLGFAYLRGEGGWPVVGGRVSVAGADELGRMKGEVGDGVIVCDLPGSDSMALVRLLMEMDLVLSPVGVGAAELMVAANFASLVKGLGLPVVFVGNNVPVGRGRREEMLGALASLDVEVCPVMVQGRVAHLDSLREGLGVCEAFPGSAACAEIDALWEWVCQRVGFEVIKQGGFEHEPAEQATLGIS